MSAILFADIPAYSPTNRSQFVVTRESLLTGEAEALVRADAPSLSFLSEDARRASLEDILSSRPPGDLWIFAYGSLIWNPAIRAAEGRFARLDGWRRRFCLSMPGGRGTPENPGLALGLDRGGVCHGIAYRLSESNVTSELTILLRREMLLNGYTPKWLDLMGEDGSPLGTALTFVIDVDSALYVGDIPASILARRLARTSGRWGSSADYLFQTRNALRALGAPDPELEVLGGLVEEELQMWELDRAA